MSKPKRGKHVKTIPNWRGTCPECQRSGVKLLWVKVSTDNSKQNVFKRCGN